MRRGLLIADAILIVVIVQAIRVDVRTPNFESNLLLGILIAAFVVLNLAIVLIPRRKQIASVADSAVIGTLAAGLKASRRLRKRIEDRAKD